MTLLLVAVFLSVLLAVVGIGLLLGRLDPAVRRRVRELGGARPKRAPVVSLTQTVESHPLRRIVASIGSKVPASPDDVGELRRKLIQAGYRDASAPVFFMGLRILLGAALPAVLL